jgi:phosphatidylglycerol---prolipoprotein diacylglyceryl transferase
MEATFAVPFFHLGAWDVGIPIQAFGVIVAAGVLIGAALLRRYAEWHGVSDEHIRGLTGWITVTGFLGAHWFNAIFYEWDKLSKDPVLFFKLWDGISSYGGFVGGAAGFALYVWWKRLPVRLFADIAIVGLLPAFSIGRIGCTVVSDHVGAFVDKTQWYAALAMNYPRDAAEYTQGKILSEVADQIAKHPKAGPEDTHILLWNLGLVEFLYLVPVNLFILWYAFRSSKRGNAGMIAVMAGVLYAPVRFFMDFLRPTGSDPRIAFDLTFAQVISIVAFAVAVYVLSKIIKNGAPAETVTKTSKEAQERLRVILKEEDEKADKDKDVKDKSKAKSTPAKKRPPTDDDEDDDDDEDEKPVAKKKEADKPKPKPIEVAPTEPSVEALPKDFVEKAKAAKKAEDEADAKKAKAEKKPEKKAEDKKADEKKPDENKVEAKADDKKADENKADEKKVEAKADDKKADDKKADEKKADEK